MTASTHANDRLGIIVGGGPAPGINGVISAAVIEASNHGIPVLGIQDGFRWLAQGDTSKVRELTAGEMSGLHLTGGSIIGTSRENPSDSPEKMRNVVKALESLGVTHLLAIGGDDTAFSMMNLAGETGARIRCVSVPKTIDNDLPLPGNMATFGYETARHLGVQLLRNIMTDAWTTGRWYLAVTMGRKAGHLALGIGKAAGATLTVIAEEFNSGRIRVSHLVDILETSIIKRRALGRADGVAVLAEGILERLEEEAQRKAGEITQDEFGHLRLAELNLGKLLKRELKDRFEARGENIQIVEMEIGYELRCAPPIPLDAEYVRDLGFGAVRFLLRGGTGALLTVEKGRAIPIYLTELVDQSTGRIKVRYVDTETEGYEVAREYMTRLRAKDFDDPGLLGRMAAAMQMDADEFRRKFGYLTGLQDPDAAATA